MPTGFHLFAVPFRNVDVKSILESFAVERTLDLASYLLLDRETEEGRLIR